jgi:hypothetical protein
MSKIRKGTEMEPFHFIPDPVQQSTQGARDLARPEARRARRSAQAETLTRSP